MTFQTLKVVFKPMTHAVILTIAVATKGQSQSPEMTEPYASMYIETTAAPQITSARHLQILSQSIPTFACYAYTGFSPETSNAALAAAIADFDGTLRKLEAGDEDTGAPAEPRILTQTRAKFEPLRVAVNGVGENAIDMTAMQVLADQNMGLQDVANTLVDALIDDTADPLDQLRPDAMAVTIATRQIYFAQKIAKDVCLATSGINQSQSLADLRGTMDLFRVSLYALQHGMKNVGIPPPSTPEIDDEIALVQFKWASFKGLLDIVAKGDEISTSERQEILVGLNGVIADMTAVADLYIQAAEGPS